MTKQLAGRLLLEDRQGPAPAGQLARDRDVGDRGTLAAVDELHPAGMESPVALIAPGPSGRGGQLPPIPHGLADYVAGSVVPGSLDQQPTHVGVTGLGDRPLGPAGTRGVLAGHQAD